MRVVSHRLIVTLVFVTVAALFAPSTSPQIQQQTNIGRIVSELERRNAADEARAARAQFLFLQQQQLLALNKLASVQSASCGGGSRGNSTVDAMMDAMMAADRTFALQQQTKAQQEVAAASKALFEAISKNLVEKRNEPWRVFKMSEATFKASGLATLKPEQFKVLDSWMAQEQIGIQVVSGASEMSASQPKSDSEPPRFSDLSGDWRDPDDGSRYQVTAAGNRLYLEEVFSEEQKRNFGNPSSTCDLGKDGRTYTGVCQGRYSVPVIGGAKICRRESKIVVTDYSPLRMTGTGQTLDLTSQTVTRSDWQDCFSRFSMVWKNFTLIRPSE